MPTKNREYYLTTSPSKDFTWFFKTSATGPTAKSKAQAPCSYRISKVRRPMMPPVKKEQESGRALVSAVDAKTRSHAPKVRPEPAEPKRSEPKKGGLRKAGPWSDWYVSEDHSYMWRARKSQNEAWDYQFTQGHQEPAQFEDTILTTCSSDIHRPLSPSPEKSPPSPEPSKSHNPASPKSSWPTIVTTSTGQPTEFLSASSSRTLTTLREETDDNDIPGTTSTALVPMAIATQLTLPRGNIKSNRSSPKRTVGPVMRLLQEGRSRKSKRKSETVQSSANDTSAVKARNASGGKPQKLPGQGQEGTNRTNDGASGEPIPGNSRTNSAFARKLHAKVKSEKELKVDPKRRVKAWLKYVEIDMTPIPLDIYGFPIY
ncbi:hypothetical protein C8A03DRAFT_13964 [Achaetomium macrosporum]|uniref:Uncharacterized protein n=1 Tax=Achaetomium macrosporum TaxID=79813 RepID=A0AAN7H874_9PEZI|nr:hypothetical protein C8A03DRAFT_13964 [Achaetomium macrosporum]